MAEKKSYIRIGKCKLTYGGKTFEGIGQITIPVEHPIDEFNRLTSHGFKLNLISGKYER